MIKQFIKSSFVLSISAALLLGCKTDEPLPQLLAGFTSTSLGLTLTDNQANTTIELSRTASEATRITLTIGDEVNATYGVDYTTEPTADNHVITLEIPAGSASADLVINKLKNPEFEEIKSFNITLNEVSNDGSTGTNNVLAVSFEENPTSSGAVIAPEVGGPEQPNQVFIDLSKQKTTTVAKGSWDLAFSNDGQFRVMLNYATYSMARATGQTDLASVSDALVTEDYKNEMQAGEINTEYMDDPSGDLSKTAIAEISETDAENFVYVINRGQLDTEPATERGFVKARITRDGADFVITYGNINDVSGFTSVTIPESADTHFTYFSFDDGVVDVAPAKDSWDFEMTTFLNEYPSGDDVYSYKFKDFALTNQGSVKITSVDITDEVTYDNFTSDNLSTITLEDNRLGIGGSWRVFDFGTFTYTINSAIFYVIEDTDGNHYKLKFTQMVDEQGNRGYPEFVYELL